MKIILVGDPIAKKRPRFSTRAGYVVTYDPQEESKRDVKKRFIDILKQKLNSIDKGEAMEASSFSTQTAFKVCFYFYLPISKSDNIKTKNLKKWGIKHHNIKPDYDNLEKFYLDCANGILWKDDCMIVESHSYKNYDENPRMEVTIVPKKQISLNGKVESFFSKCSKSELKDFIYDAKCISRIDLDERYALEDCLIEPWLTNVAIEISTFSIKYADLLSKIKKIGDVKEENATLKSNINKLVKGDFSIKDCNEKETV